MNTGRILITGATGFIGRHLVPHLLSAGHRLTLAVRNADAYPALWRNHADIRVVATGPLETTPNLGDVLVGVDRVIHLAGLAHIRHSHSTQGPFESANAIATARLAEAAADCTVATFVHMSSLAAITDNSSSLIVDDETDEEPVTPYGKSKRIAEKHVEALAGRGIFAVSLRPPLVVGADARGNWRALQRLAMTGLPLPFANVANCRSLVDIDTLVQALAHLTTSRWTPSLSGNYCVADKERVSLPRIVTALRTGMEMPPRLLSFPPGLLRTVLHLTRRRQMAAGLLGDLVVDSCRFRRVFNFSSEKDLICAIVDSGRQYRRLSGHETMENSR